MHMYAKLDQNIPCGSIVMNILLTVNEPTDGFTYCREIKKKVSMIRKYHNHKLQTTLWHREEEPLNHQETPGRQIKQSNQLSLRQTADSPVASRGRAAQPSQDTRKTN